MSTLVLERPFTATGRQRELRDAWEGPAREILADGAVRSGKTQGAARLIVEDALNMGGLYVVARMTYRELKDSTQMAMLDGDGDLPALIPHEARDRSYGTDGYSAADAECRLLNGARIRWRNLEHAHTWLNTSLAGIMIDQAEELDEGVEGERLYDTILSRLSDPRGRRKVLLVANPASEMHWLYRRFVDPVQRHPSTARVHFRLHDNADNLPADLVEALDATAETRPYWHRCYVLGEWGAFEGAAYPMFDEAVHVVVPFRIPSDWLRVEGMDHGVNNPTAWLWCASDNDGCQVVYDEYYAPGMVSDHAAEVWRRRKGWDRRPGNWPLDRHNVLQSCACFGDPTIKNRFGLKDVTGRELSVETEYADANISISAGQNDRREGYARVLELLKRDSDRVFPTWHPEAGTAGADGLGAPRMFVFSRCDNVIRQIRGAPVKPEGKDALDTVDADWESQHGHAHAALRYMVMGRLGPTPLPEASVSDRDWHTLRMVKGGGEDENDW